MCHGFGIKVLAYDPYACEERLKAAGICQVAGLQDLAGVDIVGIFTTLSEETRGMVDEQFLHSLQESMIVINVSRGAIVDEVALAKAMHERTWFRCFLLGTSDSRESPVFRPSTT